MERGIEQWRAVLGKLAAELQGIEGVFVSESASRAEEEIVRMSFGVAELITEQRWWGRWHRHVQDGVMKRSSFVSEAKRNHASPCKCTLQYMKKTPREDRTETEEGGARQNTMENSKLDKTTVHNPGYAIAATMQMNKHGHHYTNI